MEEGEERAGDQGGGGGVGTAAVVPAVAASTSKSSIEPVATTATETTATAFLEQAGLGFLASKFAEAGFLSKEDVVCLTPRKFDVLGVKGMGTKIRLKRTIEDASYSRAKVRVAGEVLEFRMPLGSSVGDLCSVISKQT